MHKKKIQTQQTKTKNKNKQFQMIFRRQNDICKDILDTLQCENDKCKKVHSLVKPSHLCNLRCCLSEEIESNFNEMWTEKERQIFRETGIIPKFRKPLKIDITNIKTLGKEIIFVV